MLSEQRALIVYTLKATIITIIATLVRFVLTSRIRTVVHLSNYLSITISYQYNQQGTCSSTYLSIKLNYPVRVFMCNIRHSVHCFNLNVYSTLLYIKKISNCQFLWNHLNTELLFLISYTGLFKCTLNYQLYIRQTLPLKTILRNIKSCILLMTWAWTKKLCLSKMSVKIPVCDNIPFMPIVNALWMAKWLPYIKLHAWNIQSSLGSNHLLSTLWRKRTID